MSLALALLVVASACRQAEPPPVEANQTPDSAEAAPFPIISEDGIGAARRGMTLGEVRASLPAGTRLGDVDDRFMVDIVAVPVIAGADTVYYLLFGAGEASADGTQLELVATTHPSVRTEAGIGPGTLLQEAAANYGAPTLVYSIHDESREYARFPQLADSRIMFRVSPAGDRNYAGDYPEPRAEYNTTDKYDAASRISMILVNVRD